MPLGRRVFGAGQPGSRIGLEAVAQEGDDRSLDGVRIVDEGPVSAALQHDHLRPRERLPLALGLLNRDVGIGGAPDDERWAVELAELRDELLTRGGRRGPVDAQDGPPRIPYSLSYPRDAGSRSGIPSLRREPRMQVGQAGTLRRLLTSTGRRT